MLLQFPEVRAAGLRGLVFREISQATSSLLSRFSKDSKPDSILDTRLAKDCQLTFGQYCNLNNVSQILQNPVGRKGNSASHNYNVIVNFLRRDWLFLLLLIQREGHVVWFPAGVCGEGCRVTTLEIAV